MLLNEYEQERPMSTLAADAAQRRRALTSAASCEVLMGSEDNAIVKVLVNG